MGMNILGCVFKSVWNKFGRGYRVRGELLGRWVATVHPVAT